MNFGVTFSFRQAEWLGLDSTPALQQILAWPIQTVRLPVYWSEHQPTPEKCDFSRLAAQLQACQAAGKMVVLSCGMKAPRWPEFYFPNFVAPSPQAPQTQQQFLTFLEQLIEFASRYSSVKFWQVENEPLNPSGPQHQVIPKEFLKKELVTVRAKTALPVVLTTWGNDLQPNTHWQDLTKLADIVGIDLYFKQYLTAPLGTGWHVGPKLAMPALKKMVEASPKKIWLSELQAEPWEKDDQTFRSAAPPSCSVKLLKNWLAKVSEIPFDQVHFWGSEYWLWRSQQADYSYVEWAETGFQL